MINFIIAVYSAPAQSGAHSAYQFSKAVLSQGHKISQIFFYQDGILNGCENQPLFSELAKFNIPLLACSTALSKRNINLDNLNKNFQAASLTQFFDVLFKADRYVVFGN